MMAVSPSLLTSIEGFNIDQSAIVMGDPADAPVPVDPSGAVGPNHVVNAGNAAIQWFTKAGLQQGPLTSLRNFFAPLNPSPILPGDNETISRPRVLYDQFANRFVVMAAERLDNGADDPSNMSRFLVAVSDDSDPNGTWYFQSVNSEVNVFDPVDAELVPYYADYPGLAVDKDVIYITANLREFDGGDNDGDPIGNRLWIVNKGRGTGGLYDGGRSVARVFDPAGLTGVNFRIDFNDTDPVVRSMQPAHIFGNAPTGVGTWLVMYDGQTDGLNELVDVIRVDNPLATTPTFTRSVVNVGDIEADPFDPLVYPMPDAAQRGGTDTIEGADRRIVSVVWRNNSLYATTMIYPIQEAAWPDTNQVTGHWFRFNTTNLRNVTLADQGDVSGDALDEAYLEGGFKVHTLWPVVAVDKFDNMAVGFGASGPNLYVGAYYAVRTTTDPAGTLRDAMPLAVGQDVFDQAGTPEEWGRYSSVALDPNDDVTFWAYNAYALPEQGQGGRWGTRWGSFRQGTAAQPPAPGPSTISGIKWHDLDDGGDFDTDEKGIGGTLIYVDLDGDGSLDLTEPVAVTKANGTYSITVNVAGTYRVRESIPAGWRQTYPGPDLYPNAPFAHEIVIPAGGGVKLTGINFGNSDNDGFDHGDAPAPYPTLEADNGPTHPIVTGWSLGTLIDGEPDGLPSVDARGDDDSNLTDEDGVVLPDALSPGSLATMRVTTRTPGSAQGRLQVWVDFNRDGDWNDPGEQVFKDHLLATATTTLSFTVPPSANPGTTYLRFRFAQDAGLGVTGQAKNGEVEDYAINILSDSPIANDDAFPVPQNSANNRFNVLLNDVPAASGRQNLMIASVNVTGASGTAVIDRNNTPTNYTDDVILYTPAQGAFAPDAFQYTVMDLQSGKTDTAVVSVTVIPFSGNVPDAVDDSYFWPTPSPATLDLYVLDNDRKGPTGSISIPVNGLNTTGTLGSVQLRSQTVGGVLKQYVTYTPPTPGFQGSDQFQYTIVDTDGVTDTATVTIHKPTYTLEDKVRFRLAVTDVNGNAITQVGQGLQFQVRAYVQDMRGLPGYAPLESGLTAADQGVYSAYMDLLYDAAMVAYAGDAKLFPYGCPAGTDGALCRAQFPYSEGINVGSAVPGILDEIGSFQPLNTPLGTGEQLLYAATFTASARGTATFKADPADVIPLHETAVNFPPEPRVDWEQIEFTSTSVNIVESPALAQIRLVATDLNGAALPGDRVQAGSDFLVSALVKDVRQPPDPAYPGLTAADLGVFSAYLDIFYPQAAVRPVASATSPFGYVIAFNTALFGGGQKAEFIPTSGIVNEVGAYQGTSAVNFSNEQLLFSIRFTALTPPSGSASVVFQADPADAQPVNEVTLIKPNPGISVPTAQVTYLNSQMITIVGAAGEGEFTNPANPMDVNGDGFASPMDVLIVINYLNSFGTTDLRTSSAQGEGEGAARYYYDVNGDKVISPADALGVINHLNSLARGAAGEGEFAVPSVPSEAAFLALDVQTALPVSENSGASADSSRGSIYPPNEVGELSNEAALAAGLDAAMAAEESLVDELAKDVALSWLTESVDEEFFAELA